MRQRRLFVIQMILKRFLALQYPPHITRHFRPRRPSMVNALCRILANWNRNMHVFAVIFAIEFC
jgi:hypothetical protein